jgi:murein L,D-transpeptidase YcbB/YkuD
MVAALLAASGGTAAAQLPRATGCEDKPASSSQLAAAKQSIPAQMSRLKLRLNLPAYRLELFQDDKLIRRYVVAIGDTAYPTPIGTFAVTRVDWDPWWTPPASEWAQNDSVTPPGPRNPMGRVRLAFRDLYFIHGTPYPHSVGSPASHGCVRLSNANAIDLAKRVLALNAPSVPRAQVDKLAAKRGTTQSISLEQSVPLEIRYDVARVQSGQLIVYPDVYHLLGPDALLDSVMATLRRSVGDSVALDTSGVADVIARAKGKRLSAEVAALTRAISRTTP